MSRNNDSDRGPGAPEVDRSRGDAPEVRRDAGSSDAGAPVREPRRDERDIRDRYETRGPGGGGGGGGRRGRFRRGGGDPRAGGGGGANPRMRMQRYMEQGLPVDDDQLELPPEPDLPEPGDLPVYTLEQLKALEVRALVEHALALGIDDAAVMRKPELTFQILRMQTEATGLIFAEGVLEIIDEDYGFLRAPEYSYL